MELFKIEIKPFLKISWVSPKAKEKWESALQRAKQLAWRLEIESVAEGLRLASWQTIDEWELPIFSKKMLQKRLITIPVRFSEKFDGFAHKFEPAEKGRAKNISVIVTRKKEVAEEFIEAYEKGDHILQGNLLGYPPCCVKFFAQVWLQGYYDPIWQIAQNSEILEKEANRIRVKAHPFSNPILRYAGLRLSFHIPCSFSCPQTIQKAKEKIILAREIDKESAMLLEALLRMPASWDVLHGIAVIRTPIFYLITSSIPTKEKYVVESTGDFIPREGVKGAVYPFNLRRET